VKGGRSGQGRLLGSRAITRRGGGRGRTHKRGGNHPVPVPESCERREKTSALVQRARCQLAAPVLGRRGQTPGIRGQGSQAAGIPGQGRGHWQSDWKRGTSPQPLEATPVTHEEKVPLQGRCCKSPRQVEHHSERFPVAAGIGHAGGDLWWPGVQMSQVLTSHVAEVRAELSWFRMGQS